MVSSDRKDIYWKDQWKLCEKRNLGQTFSEITKCVRWDHGQTQTLTVIILQIHISQDRFMKGTVFWCKNFRGPHIIKPFSAYYKSFLWTLASINPNKWIPTSEGYLKPLLYWQSSFILHSRVTAAHVRCVNAWSVWTNTKLHTAAQQNHLIPEL